MSAFARNQPVESLLLADTSSPGDKLISDYY